MNNEDFQKSCKQRFKGVEHFLRRIAFNLGNTPSQTEVKIISCIPIDVTDLQQKIVYLEKELHEARKGAIKSEEKLNNKQTTNIGMALYGSPSTVSRCNIKTSGSIGSKSQKKSTHCCDCSSELKKSNVSFMFPSTSTHGITDHQPSLRAFNFKNEKYNFLNNERVKNLFRKRKHLIKEKDRGKTHLIYYAQTPNTHINNIGQLDGRALRAKKLSSSYLSDVLRKYHDINRVVNEYSDTSQFSKPICRDVRSSHVYDSDICSCCQGRFRNLDSYINKFGNNYTDTLNVRNTLIRNNTFNFMDTIPVKESPSKDEKYKILENNKEGNIYCWPEKMGAKHMHRPFIVNYEIETPTKNKLSKKEEVKQTKIKRVKPYSKAKQDRHTTMETSQSCCIDCGDTYIKFQSTNINPTKLLSKTQNIDKGDVKPEENEATQLKNTQCVKTAAALDEIKETLQSFLAEMKTNAIINNPIDNNKKDAVVQNGISRINGQGGSTFLHSYTYNTSYNANPYLVPYSRQLPVTQYYIPSIPYDPMKYVQNYPTCIQPAPGQHICSCYCKDVSRDRHAISTSTNTEGVQQDSCSNETAKLIKEIYKSVAHNMEYPSQEQSINGYDDLKSSDNEFDTKLEQLSRDTTTIAKKDEQVEALLSPLISHTTNSKFVYTASSQSNYQNKSIGSNLFNSGVNKRRNTTYHNYKTNDIIEEDEYTHTGTPYSDTATEKTTITESKNDKIKTKKGFLKNMFNSVKLFKRNKEETCDEMIFASDSEDYETVYSEKAINTNDVKKKPISGISYVRPPAKRYKKITKYMEHEYKRHCNEDPTFRDRGEYYTPRRTGVQSSTSKRYEKRPIYWRDYEARNVFLEPLRPKEIKLINKSKAIINKSGKIKSKSKLAWLRKHKSGIRCGQKWKQFILES